jgi:hypothetical protein
MHLDIIDPPEGEKVAVMSLSINMKSPLMFIALPNTSKLYYLSSWDYFRLFVLLSSGANMLVNKIIRIPVGADLSCALPIYRPFGVCPDGRIE